MLIESGVVHRGTANKLLNGKDYYRMLRVHLIIFSAMFDVYWEVFEVWLLDNENYSSQYDDFDLFKEDRTC